MKFLIVDDMLVIRRHLNHILSPYGECDLAESGVQAVQKVRESLENSQPYDLICLDIMMPKQDGIMTLQLIRELEKNKAGDDLKPAKILMITSLNESDYIMACLTNGCDGYLIKPIDRSKLFKELARLGIM